MTVAVKGLT